MLALADDAALARLVIAAAQAVHVYRLDELSNRAGRGHASAASNGLLTNGFCRPSPPPQLLHAPTSPPSPSPQPDRRRTAVKRFGLCLERVAIPVPRTNGAGASL